MAKLPTITHPLFDLTIPSTKKKTKIRPMLVREEKILLMAKESENPYEIFLAIKQVVGNCLAESGTDINHFTIFDLEYAFLQIRAVSINNVVTVVYLDSEDAKEYTFHVDLNKIAVKFPENLDMKIQTGDKSGFVMRYPLADIYNTPVFNRADASESELVEELLISSIESYFDDDKVYKLADNKREDIKEFLNNLDIASYGKIREFVAKLPTLNYEIKYENSLKHERTITLTTLTDFFTLA
jgi:hypothetical protein